MLRSALLLALPVASIAEPVAELHPSNYVNDFANVLHPETESDLNQLCKQVDEKAHAQIAVVTINSLDGRDIEGYAVDLFQKWGIGNKSTQKGVLILIAIRDRRYRTEVGYGLEPILPDGKVGGFWRQVLPLMRQGDYDQAISENTRRVASAIAQDAGVELTGIPRGGGERAPPSHGISLFGIFILIGLAFLVFGPLRGLLFWLLVSSGGGRRGGWGGGTGGGFGGGMSSGGGWAGGGFGGGGGQG
ncbi:MAG: TPM domain-containing protein, partial [Acidobacteria bacterium]|nr:TPM domain-containing protein [Acidobacteriota bacterium]